MDEVFLNMAKAFDKLPHQKLLFKLYKYGITEKVLNWIESFLSQRLQKVKVRGVFSKTCIVLSGVPQGSVLGPLLFLLFINDLPLYIRSKSKIFADDTKIYRGITSDDDVNVLQEDLNNINQWCKTWGMLFNTSKCHVLHIGKHNWMNYYHIEGRLIAPSTQEKDLGVIVSSDLKPDNHIDSCVKKANCILRMIKTTFTFIDNDIFLRLYKTFIRPILEYCQAAWSPYLQKDIDRLENVQKRATKMVRSLSNLSYEDRLKELKLFKLEDRRKRGDMILVYKIMNGLVNIPKDTFFTPSTVDHQMELRRHNQKLKLTKPPRTQIRNNVFSERSIIPWNTLPAHVVSSKTLDLFKGNYDKYKLRV